MRVIQEGDIKLTWPWWTRVRWQCGGCQCQFEMEPEDSARVKTYSDQREGTWATTTCPTCHKSVNVDYPSDPWGR